MLLLTFLLSLSVPVPAQTTEVKGVHPSSYSKYVPTSSNFWSCLDGSRSIPWSAVNDDYCDCPDGSDEPGMTPHNRPIRIYDTLILHLGTSACPNSSFFCPNIGHVGASISATRVNDGLCGQFILFPFFGSPSSSMKQSQNVATDPTNLPAYVPTSVTGSVPITEHSWNKTPNYVRPYVSLPSFPETLSFRHIFRVQKYAHPTSLLPRKKRPVSRQSSPPPNGKSPHMPTSSFVLRVHIRSLSYI